MTPEPTGPPIIDWTCVLSGPLAQRPPLLAALHQAGIDIADQPTTNPSHHLELEPDPTVGWITCRAENPNEPAVSAGNAGWVLRAHWPTPPCRVCDGTGRDVTLGRCSHCSGVGRTNKAPRDPALVLADTINDLTARLAVLEARGA